MPKTTLAFWTKDLKLSPEQASRLKKKQLESVKKGTQARSEKVTRTIEQIEVSAVRDVDKLSKRELWLMGIILYWKSQNKHDVKKGVGFTTSDPDQARLFLKWLKEAGRIERDEIVFDIFMGATKKNLKQKEQKEALNFWSIETGFPQDNFVNFYHYNRPSKAILKIRVKASSMLARQLEGWIKAIKSLI